MPHIFNYELLNVELALLHGNSLIKCMDFFSDYWHVPNIKDCSQTQLLWTLHRNIILKLFFSNRKQIFETFGGCYYSSVTNKKSVPLSQMINTGQFPLLRSNITGIANTLNYSLSKQGTDAQNSSNTFNMEHRF